MRNLEWNGIYELFVSVFPAAHAGRSAFMWQWYLYELPMIILKIAWSQFVGQVDASGATKTVADISII